MLVIPCRCLSYCQSVSFLGEAIDFAIDLIDFCVYPFRKYLQTLKSLLQSPSRDGILTPFSLCLHAAGGWGVRERADKTGCLSAHRARHSELPVPSSRRGSIPTPALQGCYPSIALPCFEYLVRR